MSKAKIRANQLYRKYLDCRFDEEYYRAHHSSVIRKTKNYDFWITLGTLATGGSGLGILADPQFAFVCGGMTTASMVLTAYKQSKKLDQEAKDCLERVAFFALQRASWQKLVDDLQVSRDWTDDFESRFEKIVDGSAAMPPFAHEFLDEKRLREIQEKIKSSIDYEKFWQFERG